MVKIGGAIKFFRIQRCLKQSELAERTGLDVSYISLIENDKRNPTVETMGKIAGALNVPLFLFFWYVDEWEKYEYTLVQKLAAMLIVGKEKVK